MTVHTAIRAKPGIMTIKDFLAFLRPRPHTERWELVDGVATMMAPPTFAHQYITDNLQHLLNAHFRLGESDLHAYQQPGVHLTGRNDFMPRPDVAVVAGVAGEEYSSAAFRVVAEVLSRSNSKAHIARKLRRYRANPDCLHVLIIQSRRIGAEVHSRGEGWTVQSFDDPTAAIALPALGFTCRLADLYRGTVLEPGRR
jgi:Uma2 family endonuclease